LKSMPGDLKGDFLENGFIVIKNFFDPSLCPLICSEMERIHRDFPLLKTENPDLHKLGEWSIKSPHIVSPLLKNFIRSKELQGLCKTLIGNEVDIFWTATAAKPKERGKSFPWHQDTGYDKDPKEYITVWMAFDKVFEQNGGLWVVPGSHQEALLEHEFKKSNDLEYAGVFLKNLPYAREKDAIPIRLMPGDIVCMHSRLVHASFQNKSQQERRGLIAAFIKTFDYNVQHVRGIPEASEAFLANGEIVSL
jgi:phytanoyl-CoA hydroxylase